MIRGLFTLGKTAIKTVINSPRAQKAVKKVVDKGGDVLLGIAADASFREAYRRATEEPPVPQPQKIDQEKPNPKK